MTGPYRALERSVAPFGLVRDSRDQLVATCPTFAIAEEIVEALNGREAAARNSRRSGRE